MKVLAGYSVKVLETIKDAKGEIAKELASYENSYLQKDRKEAIRDYSFCVWQVHHQWKETGESRVKTLREAKQEGDWCEYPLCGYMNWSSLTPAEDVERGL